jgi:hypothetical protein
MEQGPSLEINSRLASEDISRILIKPKVHYRVRIRSPLDHILSKMNTCEISGSHGGEYEV